MTYLLTGGGTGGHVYPGLAIADEIRRRQPDARIVYVGARGKIEAQLVPQRGYPIRLVWARGLPRQKRPLALLSFLLVTTLGVLQSVVILLATRPRVVVATGGYASGPVMLALALLRRLHLSSARTFIHEQNVVPGLVNRLAGRMADVIGVSFSESIRRFDASKVVRVGYPVRREIASVTRDEARQALGLPGDAQVVFAFGGSQGSRTINRAIVDALPALLPRERLYLIHAIGLFKGTQYHAAHDTAARMVGAGLRPEDLPRYRQVEYVYDIQTVYAASDLVICRAGAATLNEVCACGLPSIIIPISNTPGDHQALNAKTLETAGAARVLYEEAILEDGRIVGAVNGRRLAQAILGLLDAPVQLAEMAARARTMFDRDVLDRIMACVDRLTASSPGQAEAGYAHGKTEDDGKAALNAIPEAPVQPSLADVEETAQLSPFQMLQFVQKHPGGQLAQVIDLDYLKYKVDGYLIAPAWQVRNVGVKLVGLLGYREKLPLLLFMLQDRTPVPWLHRLFGGDYQQVGFIRRNIVQTLIQVGEYTPEVRTALLAGLADPYYEVRSWSARAFGRLSPLAGPDDEVERRLIERLHDPSFEAVVEAIAALGKVGGAPTHALLREFYAEANSKIREAVIRTLIDLMDRGLIPDLDALAVEVQDMLVTCEDFQPTFPIKRALNNLGTALKERQQAVPCSTTSAPISTTP
ncbi:MAG: glycosyltransferase [Candidatus Latescibacteria bacterium]|nr:glycosyltransferase [Candidatus Latescibacterota bacterium]